ncbi:MAG: pyridoxal phosphate-dependent aminotransferase, partial [Acidimicrobiia bacterium]
MNAVIAAMPRSGIRELMDLAWATPGVIHLEVGEPDFATPDHILEAAARAAADGYTKYTPNAGIPEVRAAFADKVVTHNHFAATADHVVVTVGAINALAQAVMILANPGESVLIPDPGWPNYEMIATVTGTVPVRYPLLRDEGFSPDLDILEAAAADPAATLMIINSPANPTGAVFSSETLAAMLEIAARHGLWVVSDECYEDIVFEGPHVSAGRLLDDGRVVSVFSVSKSYAMTGWRVGYVVASP